MSDPKARRVVVVTNPQGMHARPAHEFVTLASKFAAEIEVVKDHERVDGKSILGLLTLAAVEGTELSIEAVGPDAERALDALAELFASGFAEKENEQHE